jgi:hypothetical protein
MGQTNVRRNNRNTVLEQAEHCSMMKHAVIDMLIRRIRIERIVNHREEESALVRLPKRHEFTPSSWVGLENNPCPGEPNGDRIGVRKRIVHRFTD